MTDINIIKDYGWKKPIKIGHEMLLKALIGIIKDFNICEKSNILDAGCGGGYILNELYVRKFKNVWGFDISRSGIDVAKKNFLAIKDRFAIHNIYTKKLPLSFPEKDYDIIISMEVIEHSYSPKIYLENINYWLKKGGYLIITTPYHAYLKNLLIALLNKSDKHYGPLWEGGHIKFFSRKDLCKILKNTGFRPIKFYGCGRILFLWKSMIIVAQKI